MADSSYARRNWFRHNHGVFIARNSLDAIPVRHFTHTAHCEVWFQTAASFTGSFTIYVVPSYPHIDGSAIGVWVDGVLNQTIQFDVGADLGKLQSAVVDVGTTGAHVIRIQEGERNPGSSLTRVVIDGTVIPAPAIARSYIVVGDSVSMGAFGIPRSTGWAHRMKNGGSRFDSVSTIGRSGYSLFLATADAPTQAASVALIVSTCANYVGSTENVVALCLSINDWVSSSDSTTAAAYQAKLGPFADAIKAAADAQGLPGFKIMLHSMTHIHTDAQLPNDKGSTPAEFNTAIQAVAAARPTFTTYLDLFDACLDADLEDLFDHPNVVGHGKIYDVVVAAT